MTMTTWLVALAMLAATPDDIATVEVEGVGATENEAEKDAFQHAIRQVVGAYVDSTTIATHEDEVKSMTLEMSKGSVEGYESLEKSKTAEGLFLLRLRVRVRKGDVLSKVQNSSFASSLDGQQIWASAVTQAKSVADGDEILKELIKAYSGLLKGEIYSNESTGKSRIEELRGGKSFKDYTHPGVFNSRVVRAPEGPIQVIGFRTHIKFDKDQYFDRFRPLAAQVLTSLPRARKIATGSKLNEMFPGGIDEKGQNARSALICQPDEFMVGLADGRNVKMKPRKSQYGANVEFEFDFDVFCLDLYYEKTMKKKWRIDADVVAYDASEKEVWRYNAHDVENQYVISAKQYDLNDFPQTYSKQPLIISPAFPTDVGRDSRPEELLSFIEIESKPYAPTYSEEHRALQALGPMLPVGTDEVKNWTKIAVNFEVSVGRNDGNSNSPVGTIVRPDPTLVHVSGPESPGVPAIPSSTASSGTKATTVRGGRAVAIEAATASDESEPDAPSRIGNEQHGGKAANRSSAPGLANGDCEMSARQRQKRAVQRSEIRALLSKMSPGDDRRIEFETRLKQIDCGEDGSVSGPALQVDVKPFGAEITLDGNFVGETPMLLDKLTPGQHKLQLAHSDHDPVEVEVEIHAEGRTTVTAELLRTSKAIEKDYRTRNSTWEMENSNRFLLSGGKVCGGLMCGGLCSALVYSQYQNYDLQNAGYGAALALIGFGVAGWGVADFLTAPPAPQKPVDEDGELVIQPPTGRGEVVRVPLKRKELPVFLNEIPPGARR